MMTYKNGDLIKFKNEKKPFKVMAGNDKFLICQRKLCRRADADLLKHNVEMGGYMSFTSAYNNLKDEPVYTIVDFDKKIRGPHNIIFNNTDFRSELECEDLLNDLMNKECIVSRRHFVDLEIELIEKLKKKE